jgi:transcription initiation factor IIF auxiliary subunit
VGYYVNLNLIKERINMSKETLKQTVNTITHLDSMKAVKVAFDLSESNQDSINKVMQIVGGNVDNINLLAERIAKLEKRLEMYERPKN